MHNKLFICAFFVATGDYFMHNKLARPLAFRVVVLMTALRRSVWVAALQSFLENLPNKELIHNRL